MPTDFKVQVHNPDWVATEVAPELIGRDQELAEVVAALRVHALVTLVGSGGIGKTSLAMAVAYAVADQFADGVFVVPLAEVATHELLLLTLAKVLDVRLQPAQPWAEQLAAHVQDKSMLLVLDNFEQLLDWVEPISQMSRTARGVKFLVTSREKLGVPAEHAIVLQGMSLASQSALASQESALSSAELLFLHYARRVRPGFKLAREDREPVQRICKLVDGMPLAIELAAAWVSLLPCRFIADQIQQNMDWLTTSVGFTHQQQKSVRAVLDYFWGMLSADERVCLQKLSVFSGGFERDLAHEIAGASLFFLSALVDRAYLSRTSAGRYFMHEMLKQYAAEKLNSDPNQKQAAGQKHAEAYAVFADRTRKAFDGPEHLTWSPRFEVEHNNFRAALDWFLGQCADAEKARTMGWHLMGFWYQNGYLTEGRRWLKRAIDASPDETKAMSDALCCEAFLAAAQGDYDDSKRSGLHALRICERLNDEEGISEVLHNLAFNESFANNNAEAIRLYERHLVLERARGDKASISISVHNLALSYHGLGQLERAAEFYRESIALGIEVEDVIGIGYSRALLMLVCLEINCGESVLPEFLESLVLFASSNDVTGSVTALETSAVILERRGGTDAYATQLWVCARQFRHKHQLKLNLHLMTQFEAMADRLRERLGENKFEAEKLRGEAMNLHQALRLARQQIAALVS